ncbi:hypothetical protein OE88DRAFT_728522 [Heliocybe sulcata]|uniref:F-box domain-containing protein n=1 Tax=Heliocybe sulcata TaxID=5364 RepID=A0A5C3NFZ6_9AGAM|nr:hypothetical protein OE88DRAFT_728522 [Heliocybe sulcata]
MQYMLQRLTNSSFHQAWTSSGAKEITQLARMHNASMPVARLPDDILIEIFYYNCHHIVRLEPVASSVMLTVAVPSIVLASWVCHQWHRAATCALTLWEGVIVEGEEPSIWSSTLKVESPCLSSWTIRPSHATRRTIVLHLPKALGDSGLDSSHADEQLEEGSVCIELPKPQISSPAAVVLPMLRASPSGPLHFGTLKKLHLTGPTRITHQEFGEVMDTCRHLTHLTLVGQCADYKSEWESNLRPLNPPRLQHLTLNFNSEASAFVSSFFSSFFAPTLLSLTIISIDCRVLALFTRALGIRSQSVKYEKLIRVDIHTVTITNEDDRLWVLHGVRLAHCLPAVEYFGHGLVLPGSALLTSLTHEGPDGKIIWPRLQVLDLYFGSQTSPMAVRALMSHRLSIGYPIERLRVHYGWLWKVATARERRWFADHAEVIELQTHRFP